MKTGKRNRVLTLAVALLIPVMVLISCIDFPEIAIDSESDGSEVPGSNFETPVSGGGYKPIAPDSVSEPAKAKGYVRLTFETEGTARTIRPDTSSLDELTDFNHFDVIFTPGSTGSAELFVGLTAAQVLGPYTLDEGDYTVHVWAFNVAHPHDVGVPDPTELDYEKASAYGTPATSLLIDSSGNGTSALITLKEITGPIGSYNTTGSTGKFALNLGQAAPTSYTFPATTVSLSILTYPDGNQLSAPLTPISGVSVSSLLTTYETNLPPGLYRVSLALSGTNVKAVTIPEILYIYQGMTSTFARTLPNLNTNVYSIIYTFNDGRTGPTPPLTETESVTHGDEITGTAAPPAHISGTSYSFVGWYTTATDTPTPGVEREVGVYKPIRDETLYGRWQQTGGTLSIDFDFTDLDDLDIVITDLLNDPVLGTNISRSSPPTLKFTVDNASSFAGDYTWYINGTLQAGQTSSVLTVNFSNATYFDYLIAGNLLITVENDDPDASSYITLTLAP